MRLWLLSLACAPCLALSLPPAGCTGLDRTGWAFAVEPTSAIHSGSAEACFGEAHCTCGRAPLAANFTLDMGVPHRSGSLAFALWRGRTAPAELRDWSVSTSPDGVDWTLQLALGAAGWPPEWRPGRAQNGPVRFVRHTLLTGASTQPWSLRIDMVKCGPDAPALRELQEAPGATRTFSSTETFAASAAAVQSPATPFLVGVGGSTRTTTLPSFSSAATTRSTSLAGSDRASAVTTSADAAFFSGGAPLDEAIEDAVRRGLQAILHSGATSLDLPRGTLEAVPLRALPHGSYTTAEGRKVLLPPLSSDFSHAAWLSLLTFAEGDLFSTVTNRALATPALDISLRNTTGHCAGTHLDEPILFRLLQDSPAQLFGLEGPTCVYLAESHGSLAWSTDGVRRASVAEVAARGELSHGVWCLAWRLGTFAAVGALDDLECPTMELWTTAALEAIHRNSGWHWGRPAQAMAALLSLFLLLLALGLLCECQARRLGRTPESSGKRPNLCRCLPGPEQLQRDCITGFIWLLELCQGKADRWSELQSSSLQAGIQRFLALRTGVSVSCVAQNCWSSAAWTEPKASIPYTALCCKLRMHAGLAELVMQNEMQGSGTKPAALRFLRTLVALHPVPDSLRTGAAGLSSPKRVAIEAAGALGLLATNSLIFSCFGTLRSWEAASSCAFPPLSDLFIVVATFVSFAVNALHCALLAELAKRRAGRGSAAFWLLAATHLGCSAALLVAVVAGLSQRDEACWCRALGWALAIKYLLLPLGQSLHATVLLEWSLAKERMSSPSAFAVASGLKHPGERMPCDKICRAAEAMAKRAISAEELVQFVAQLGNQVMLDFDPERSTCQAVMEGAVKPCYRPPALASFALLVEAEDLEGSLRGRQWLWCRVMHLGRLANGMRPCIREYTARQAMDITGVIRFESCIRGLEPQHAIGLALMEGDVMVGIASLTAEDILKDNGWPCLVRMVGPTQERVDAFNGMWSVEEVPLETERIPSLDITGTHITGSQSLAPDLRGMSAELPLLTVSVAMPEGYLEALALHECRRQLLPMHFQEQSAPRSPPRRVVSHSRKGLFLDLVAAVLMDVLGLCPGGYQRVRGMLLRREVQDLLDLLTEAGCRTATYWIEMFAMEPPGFDSAGDESRPWQDELLPTLPSLLRLLRHDACCDAITGIREGSRPSGAPLTQLLVLDRKFSFLQERGGLAEMMVASALRVDQRLLLHPEHLERGSSLGDELWRLADDLGEDRRLLHDRDWTAPHLNDRQLVFDTMRDLAFASVQEHMQEEEWTWQKLNMDGLDNAVVSMRDPRCVDAVQESQWGACVREDTCSSSQELVDARNPQRDPGREAPANA